MGNWRASLPAAYLFLRSPKPIFRPSFRPRLAAGSLFSWIRSQSVVLSSSRRTFRVRWSFSSPFLVEPLCRADRSSDLHLRRDRNVGRRMARFICAAPRKFSAAILGDHSFSLVGWIIAGQGSSACSLEESQRQRAG